MSLWRADPERAANALLESCLDDLALPASARVLAVNSNDGLVLALQRHGVAVEAWNRRLASGFSASAEPPAGPFDAALLRLPKSKDELEMAAHLTCAALCDGARLFVYGGNDEGIRTSARRLVSLSASTETIAARGHGRIFALTRPPLPTIRGRLTDWRTISPAGLATYPGLFADGTLDAGTALLLSHLPELTHSARVLDYGCGPGAIARGLRAAHPVITIDLLDNDAVALIAATENVPGAKSNLATDLTSAAPSAYDLILSNPPIHSGIREDHATLERLIADAPRCLKPAGVLQLVVQRRIALDAQLAKSFARTTITAEDGLYRVWRAELPRR